VGLLVSPVGPVLSVAIVAISVLVRYYVRNKRLLVVLYDALDILMKGLSLYDLIFLSHEKLHELATCEKDKPDINSIIKCFEIDKEVMDHLSNKLDSLTELLLSIMPKDGLNVITIEINNIQNTLEKLNKPMSEKLQKFQNLTNNELKDRKKMFNFTNSVPSRIYSRFFDSAENRVQIVSYTTMINGYFIIMYTQYKLLMDSYSVLHPDIYKQVMEFTIKSGSFAAYLKAKDTAKVVTKITETVVQQNGKDIVNDGSIEVTPHLKSGLENFESESESSVRSLSSVSSVGSESDSE